jgi:tRNA 2-selenouridine synthase
VEVYSLIDITVEEFLKNKKLVPVDVRSPEEFEEGTILGAVNIPLFDNLVRKEIGTIYKQIGPKQAQWRAMELVSPYIPTLLSQIKELAKEDAIPTLFCWRGGMRSKAVATFLEFAGFPVHRIEGGFRAYRQYSLEKIPTLIPDKTVVLHGMTGVGKTDILLKLQAKGYPVLDLEAMANHKGSIFGGMGPTPLGNNQKTFDALLFTRLLELTGSPFVIVEAESKRIGKITQPEELLIKKLGGVHLHLYADISTRVDRIYQEYVEPFHHEDWFHEQVKEKFAVIGKRIKNLEVKAEITDDLAKQNYKNFIKLLLEHYYDSRYQYKQTEYEGEFIQINTDHVDEAVDEIATHIDQEFSNFQLL